MLNTELFKNIFNWIYFQPTKLPSSSDTHSRLFEFAGSLQGSLLRHFWSLNRPQETEYFASQFDFGNQGS